MNHERGYWDLITAGAAVAAFVISVLALVEASDNGAPAPTATDAVAQVPAAEGEPDSPAATEAAPADPSSGDGSEIRAELREFEIVLSSAVATGSVVVEVVNGGGIIHNLVLDGGDARTPDLEVGESARLELGELDADKYVLLCDIPGHREAGMEVTLTIESR